MINRRPTFRHVYGRIQSSDNTPITVQQEVLDVVEGGVNEDGFGIVPTTTLEAHLEGYRKGIVESEGRRVV